MCKEYINLQTKEVLDLEKLTTLPDNAMLKVKPELWIEWDFEKNDELGFDIWKLTYGSNKKVYWICKECTSSYDMNILKRCVNNRNCSYCAGRKVNHTNSLASLHPQLASEWHPTKNGKLNPYDVTCGSNKKVWWICCKCDSDYDSTICNRVVGKGCPYCSGNKANHTNCLSSIRPDLVKFWDKDRNTGVNMEDLVKNSGYFAWWICESCGTSYQRKIPQRLKSSHNCQYCYNRRARYENSLVKLNPELAKQWHPTKNNGKLPSEFVPNSNEKVWWQCENGHEWETKIVQRNLSGTNCPYCTGRKAWIGESDMWTTNPELAKLLADPEDGYRYREKSNMELKWKCSECGHVLNKSPNSVSVKGLCCPNCNDNSSYSEKIVSSLLNKLGIEFQFDKATEWSDKKRYDFYIPSLSCIIETHGIQHYKYTPFSYSHIPKSQKDNDKYKKDLALKNGIKYYIELDCRKSDFEYIKNEILNSELVSILKINKEDVSHENIKELDNKTLKSWELWNKGYTTGEIAKELKISNGTVVKYLKRGDSTGVCDYNETNKGQIQNRKKVVSLNVETFELKIHERVVDASAYVGLRSITGAGKACSDNSISKGHKFMYYDDYIKYLEGFKS